MTRRRRSRRSYAVEAVLAFALVIAIYLFLASGGPSAFGDWYADLLGTP